MRDQARIRNWGLAALVPSHPLRTQLTKLDQVILTQNAGRVAEGGPSVNLACCPSFSERQDSPARLLSEEVR